MTRHVQFIMLEEDEKDLIISFAISDAMSGIKSLLLHRQLFFEHILDEDEKGVIVTLEGDDALNEYTNTLKEMKISNNEVHISSSHSEYILDITDIDENDINKMVILLNKQNYDNRFIVKIA